MRVELSMCIVVGVARSVLRRGKDDVRGSGRGRVLESGRRLEEMLLRRNNRESRAMKEQVR
jgi:hypothetical protein